MMDNKKKEMRMGEDEEGEWQGWRRKLHISDPPSSAFPIMQLHCY